MDELDVGYVAGVHGVQGAVRIKLHDPGSDALSRGTRITLTRAGQTVVRPQVREALPVPGKPGLFRAQLQGVDDREAADALRGCAVLVPRGELDDDEFYLADAIGLPVVRDVEPTALGTIVGLTSNGAQDLFEVQWVDPDRREHRWLLPVLPHVVKDVDGVRVLVELPPGLLPEALEEP